jgi:hypothetical protein
VNINVTLPEYICYLGGLVPGSHAAGTYTSGAVNTQLHNRVGVFVNVGTIGSADTVTLSFTACATSGGSYSAVTGLTAMAALNADNSQLFVDIPTTKLQDLGVGPYLKAVITVAGANSAVYSVEIFGAQERFLPASDYNTGTVTVVLNS